MIRTAGIDVGGTFTDLILYEENPSGVAVRFAKTPTTTDNQSIGVINAINSAGLSPASLDLVIHGTTVTTNALLERKLARTGLITTCGFRDVLELGRRTRPNTYGLMGGFNPLIARELRLEANERINAQGEVVIPLDKAGVRQAAERLLELGCESIVVHFLHAYANPVHEIAAGKIVREVWPNAYVTLGHSLLSECREFERGSTAAVNASVQPLLQRYIARLQAELERGGFQHDVLVMSGNGGTVPARHVAEEAAKTVMSGPASGVIAASATLSQSGFPNAITYDMGGTSTDVAVIRGGVPEVSSEITIDYGIPIHVPMIDVRSVGAGGGSIARVDAAGFLRIGPESAGSKPGPICYGRGGELPTITDAHLLLGRLDPARLLSVGEGAPIERIRAIFSERLARPLGLTVEEAAEAVIHLGNVHMSGAIRMVSVSQGHDPRDFVLFAFGGAGPLHAVSIARELGIPRVLVPARPGLTNALGCLVADFRQDLVKTINRPLDLVEMEAVADIMQDQIDRGMALNGKQADKILDTRVFHSADMQFVGQTHIIRVPVSSARPGREDLKAALDAAFFQRFQMRLPGMKAILVNINTSVIGYRRHFSVAALLDAGKRAATPDLAVIGTRPMFSGGGWKEAMLLDREMLPVGALIKGPAIVHQLDATTVIEPNSSARVDKLGNLIIDVIG
ncbi:hydantoinase/oxoprolinase family protein [Bosea sp. (in: a-proteobacteria)]|uniref:hydantoinase/oxoprolinase family protein n=1 Tax=Bosea sp. (in: a-proteobacteria) TaxID=1871050 RepID=UPI00261914B6|nr:hydantoinase/oxoprolinase family protein [Bosea sp. (in: a-proteobacteria)]MCO5089439.1 hydantoinase/oxoprolinase family protein [Bosea sp. (in: a-proteobacteria)]